MSSKNQKGVAPLLAILVVAAVGALLYFTKPWEKIGNLKLSSLSKIITQKFPEPKVDTNTVGGQIVYPQKGAVLTARGKNGVVTILTIPAGALKKSQSFSLIPLSFGNSPFLSASGVRIITEPVTFLKPVTLAFDLTDSKLRNSDPKSESSHVYRLDAGTREPVSTLMVRGLERETLIPARILSGGDFVFVVNDKNSIKYARDTLSKSGVNSLSLIEATTVLVNQKQRLTDKESKRAREAVDKILEKGNKSPILELVAAALLKEKLGTQKSGFIKNTYAQSFDISEKDFIHGLIELFCSERNHLLEEYVSLEDYARELGFSSTADLCEKTAKEVLIGLVNRAVADSSAKYDEVLKLLVFAKTYYPEETEIISRLERKLEAIARREINAALASQSCLPQGEINRLIELAEKHNLSDAKAALQNMLKLCTAQGAYIISPNVNVNSAEGETPEPSEMPSPSVGDCNDVYYFHAWIETSGDTIVSQGGRLCFEETKNGKGTGRTFCRDYPTWDATWDAWDEADRQCQEMDRNLSAGRDYYPTGDDYSDPGLEAIPLEDLVAPEDIPLEPLQLPEEPPLEPLTPETPPPQSLYPPEEEPSPGPYYPPLEE